VIFRTWRKRTDRTALIAVINAFGLNRRRIRSKGGGRHRTIFRVVREEGQAMAEYAVILGLVTATLVLVFSSLGATTVHLFDEVVSQLGP
jgi:Flp pilus assembly pilin Flp